MRAFVEIHTEPGSDLDRITAALRMIENVSYAYRVIGRADIMASVEGRNLKDVSDTLSQKICAIRGISSAEALICVEEESERISGSATQLQALALT